MDESPERFESKIATYRARKAKNKKNPKLWASLDVHPQYNGIYIV